MTPISTLFVGWQNQRSRQWFVVARLTRVPSGDEGSEYEFAYVAGVKDAIESGFQPFVAFPEIEKVIRSRSLLPFFGNRLMPSSRPDYPSYLEQLGLDQSAVEDFSLLARSGGLRTTERAEIEVFAPPYQREDGAYETHFFVRGMRHIAHSEEVLTAIMGGVELLCLLDVQNAFNSDAVLLRTEDQRIVGYVPDYLCGDLARLLRRGCRVRVTVVQVNDMNSVPAQNRLLCHLEANLPEGLSPFSDPKFKPVAAPGISQAA